jgi:nicotinate phosphoribosyltransferase
MVNYSGIYTDRYQLAMSQAYFLKGRHNTPAIFDYFFRKLPFNGGYAIYAGLEDLLEIIEGLRFEQQDLTFLKELGFHKDFVDYLDKFRFTGTIYSSMEGDLVFPARPLLQVHGSMIEAQLIETLLLNVLNFQTLIATKACRMRRAAGERSLIDFGLRRAQGPGGYYASRASFIGGLNSTSDMIAARDYGIPSSGTMAHSFVESYEDELSAFMDFADINPYDCILVIDTYDTLRSGIQNAITVARKMEESGKKLSGIRLDSGDLAYLSKECRTILDREGLEYVKIAVSNQLDEYIIKSLVDQKAPIDSFGIGTSLVTGHPDAALDGVYKLSFSDGRARIKLSENINKITLPYHKQVFRIEDKDGRFIGADAVAIAGEDDFDIMYHPLYPLKSMSLTGYVKVPLLHKVMEKGLRTSLPRRLNDIAIYSRNQVDRLQDEYKRFDNPHIYKVGISAKLQSERERMVLELKQKFR